jgi:hypothetical protein
MWGCESFMGSSPSAGTGMGPVKEHFPTPFHHETLLFSTIYIECKPLNGPGRCPGLVCVAPLGLVAGSTTEGRNERISGNHYSNVSHERSARTRRSPRTSKRTTTGSELRTDTPKRQRGVRLRFFPKFTSRRPQNRTQLFHPRQGARSPGSPSPFLHAFPQVLASGAPRPSTGGRAGFV